MFFLPNGKSNYLFLGNEKNNINPLLEPVRVMDISPLCSLAIVS